MGVRNSTTYPFVASIDGDSWSWSIDGNWSAHPRDLDLVAEYVEPVTSIDIVFKSSDFHRAGTSMYDHITSGKRAGWSKATLTDITPIEHVIPAEPAFKLEVGKRYKTRDGSKITPPLEANNDSTLPFRHPHPAGAKNCYISYTSTGGYYPDNKEYRLDLVEEFVLKLEAGKRYVLTDGRVTQPLVAEELYARPTLCAAVGDDFTTLHRWQPDGKKWNGFCDITADISHPA